MGFACDQLFDRSPAVQAVLHHGQQFTGVEGFGQIFIGPKVPGGLDAGGVGQR